MAGYNPYFNPYGGYAPQPMIPQAQQPVMPQQPQQPQNIVRVQGEEAAKAWLVAPGCSVPMLDIEAPYLYIKSVGMDGVPFPLRRFRVTEETEQQKAQFQADNDTIHRNEFDELLARVAKLEGGIQNVEPVVKRNGKQQ